MENLIEQILKDLYALDPEFKKHEARLRGIIARLLEAKPDIKVDRAFAERLKRQLAAQASLMHAPKSGRVNFAKLLNLVLGGGLIMALIVGGTYYGKTKTQTPSDYVRLLAADFSVNQLSPNAFGNLNSQTTPSFSGRGMGGGGGAPLAVAAPENNSTGNQSDAAAGTETAKIMPYPAYAYTYKGGELPDLTSSIQVFKRIPALSGQNGSSFIKQISLGLLDLKKLKQPKLQNLTFMEDKNEGYAVNIDLSQSSVNIYQLWEKWPHPESACMDESCWQQYRIKISEIPSNEEVIRAADEFIKTYGVSLSGYGSPIVNNDWRKEYERTQNKNEYYLPGEISVVYPLVIKGQTVLEESGNPSGLTVSVNVRTKQVTSLFGLTNQQYEESAYEGETDTAKLIKLAESGGWRNYLPAYTGEPNSEKVTLELETPTVGLVKIWQFNGNTTTELFVPSLIFPISTESQKGGYLPQRLVLPLAKELLNDTPGNIGIFPMQKDAVPAK